MNSSNKYSPQVRERAVRMVLEHQSEHELDAAAHLCSRGFSTSRSWSPTTLMLAMAIQKGDPGKEADPVATTQQIAVTVGDQQSQRRLRDRHSDPEEGKGRLQSNGMGNLDGPNHDERWETVGQQVAQDDACGTERQATHTLDVLLRSSTSAAPRATRA